MYTDVNTFQREIEKWKNRMISLNDMPLMIANGL